MTDGSQLTPYELKLDENEEGVLGLTTADGEFVAAETIDKQELVRMIIARDPSMSSVRVLDVRVGVNREKKTLLLILRTASVNRTVQV